MSTPAMPASAPTQIRLRLLVALVVGSILGSGIFGPPQNIAAGAGTILIGWGINGLGMRMLALAQ